MDILTSWQDGIVTIQFNRLDKKNAITAAMYQIMAETFEAADADPAIRVIVLLGQPQIFTAGHDLDDFLANPPQADDSPVLQFLNRISQARKPIVAAVSGAAIGVGTTLLLHCDLVYAAEQTRFSLPFVQLGLCPEAASSWLLPQLAGYQRAAEKLLLGEAFSAEEAHAMGLVSQVVPAGDLLPFALGQAQRLAALPAVSVQAAKKLMKAPQQARIAAQLREESQIFRQLLGAPAAQEALKAFAEKRRPDFAACNAALSQLADGP